MYPYPKESERSLNAPIKKAKEKDFSSG